MENKFFDKTEQFIAEKIKVNTAAVSVTTASVDTAKADKEKAEKKVEQALNNGDVDGYQKAHKALEKADDTITVHGSMLQRLKEDPILPQAEYESLVSDVMAEIEKNVSKDKEKIISLIDQIVEIADEDAEFIKRGNDILKKLQHDLNRDADCTTVERNGYKRHDSYREKRYKDTDVKDYAITIIQDPRYKKFGGTRKPNGDAINASNLNTVMAYHMQHVTYHNK